MIQSSTLDLGPLWRVIQQAAPVVVASLLIYLSNKARLIYDKYAELPRDVKSIRESLAVDRAAVSTRLDYFSKALTAMGEEGEAGRHAAVESITSAVKADLKVQLNGTATRIETNTDRLNKNTARIERLEAAILPRKRSR